MKKKIIFISLIILTALAYVLTTCIYRDRMKSEELKNDDTLNIKNHFTNIDSITLLELSNIFDRTRSEHDLRNILIKLDTLLKNDPSNIGILETKIMYLKKLPNDESTKKTIDSVNVAIDNEFRSLKKKYPSDQSVFFAIGVRFKEEKQQDDSANYYFYKAIHLSDSIMKISPFNKDIYSTMIYSYMYLGETKKAQEIIKKDIKKNPEMKIFLEDLYDSVSSVEF